METDYQSSLRRLTGRIEILTWMTAIVAFIGFLTLINQNGYGKFIFLACAISSSMIRYFLGKIKGMAPPVG